MTFDWKEFGKVALVAAIVAAAVAIPTGIVVASKVVEKKLKSDGDQTEEEDK